MPPQDPSTQYSMTQTMPAANIPQRSNTPTRLKDTLASQPQPLPVTPGGSTINSTRGRPQQKQGWLSRLFGGSTPPRQTRSRSLPTKVTPAYPIQRPTPAAYPAAPPRSDSPLPFADGYQQLPSAGGNIPPTQYSAVTKDVPLPLANQQPQVIDPTTIPYQGGSAQRRSRSADHYGYHHGHHQEAQIYDPNAYNQQQALVPWTGQPHGHHAHSAALTPQPQYHDMYNNTPQMIGAPAPYLSQGYDLQQFAPVIDPQPLGTPYGGLSDHHRSTSPYRSTSPFHQHTNYDYLYNGQDMGMNNMANYYTSSAGSSGLLYGTPTTSGYEYYDMNGGVTNWQSFSTPSSPWYTTSGASPLLAY